MKPSDMGGFSDWFRFSLYVLAQMVNKLNIFEYRIKEVISTMAVYHHVRKGHTLHHIARHHRTTVVILISLNPHIRNPHIIYPGQKIRVR